MKVVMPFVIILPMETKEGPPTHLETEKPFMYPYEAIMVLPYTRVERKGGGYRMSHFTSRAISAGWELYQQGKAPLFILPGEFKNPATSDLEKDYLIKKGVSPENIIDFPNLNDTFAQLKLIAALQRRGELDKVLVVAFEFHQERVREWMRRLKIEGDVAEVEETHEKWLQERSGGRSRVNREQLINLPQFEFVKRAERVARTLMVLDKPFGEVAPLTRVVNFLRGPTITDINQLSLAHIEKIRQVLKEMRHRVRNR